MDSEVGNRVPDRKHLDIRALVSDGRGHVAAIVDGSQSPDLQFVYRAGVAIGWNQERSRLEDRIWHETTDLESCQRMARAVQGELGLRLRVTSETSLEGVPDDVRQPIRDLLR